MPRHDRETVHALLHAVHDIASILAVPLPFGVPQALFLIAQISETILLCTTTGEELRHLSNDINQFLDIASRYGSRLLDDDMACSLRNFVRTLDTINQFVQQLRRRRRLARFLCASHDASKVVHYRARVNQALQAFQFSSGLAIASRVEAIYVHLEVQPQN